jgi:hypothetical protein
MNLYSADDDDEDEVFEDVLEASKPKEKQSSSSSGRTRTSYNDYGDDDDYDEDEVLKAVLEATKPKELTRSKTFPGASAKRTPAATTSATTTTTSKRRGRPAKPCERLYVRFDSSELMCETMIAMWQCVEEKRDSARDIIRLCKEPLPVVGGIAFEWRVDGMPDESSAHGLVIKVVSAHVYIEWFDSGRLAQSVDYIKRTLPAGHRLLIIVSGSLAELQSDGGVGAELESIENALRNASPMANISAAALSSSIAARSRQSAKSAPSARMCGQSSPLLRSLVELHVGLGVHFWHANTRLDAGSFLWRLTHAVRQAPRIEATRSALPNFAANAVRRASSSMRLAWLSGIAKLPGVSKARAQVIVDRFPSLGALIAFVRKTGTVVAVQEIAEMRCVAGSGQRFGPALAARIVTFVASMNGDHNIRKTKQLPATPSFPSR